MQEIKEVLEYLKFEIDIQVNKAYARDFMQRGRFRVLFKSPTGAVLNSEYPTRRSLLLKLGETIPKTKLYSQRKAQVAAGSSNAQAAAQTSKKKGKKGR